MKQPNIVILLMDTMRRDAISPYNESITTPAIKKLASESLVYDAVSPSSWTLPSHVSLFTGKYPSEHSIHESYHVKTDELVIGMNQGKIGLPSPTIAEFLRAKGYNTFGISANAQISSFTRMDAGFSVFVDITKKDEALNEAVSYGRTRGEMLVNLAKQGKVGEIFELYRKSKQRVRLSENYPVDKGGNWITWLLNRVSIEAPFFIFINMMEMHDPYPSDVKYVPNQFHMNDLFGISKIDDKLMKKIRKEYFEQSSIADQYVGRIINFLKNVYDDTLIILTSDHGQALKEKNYYGHGIYLYDELVRVPLVVKYPKGIKPERKGLISLVNIYEMLKGAAEGVYEMRNDEFVISETYGIQDSLNGIAIDDKTRKEYDVPRKAIFKDGYKLVVNGSTGAVEEFTLNGRALSTKDKAYGDLVNELHLYKGNEKFVLP
jgi:arylsulfatase A-like enzyme